MSRALVIERSRAILRVFGRDPVGMIHGLATADVAAVSADRSIYTAFLTPRGKMVADARVFLDPAGETGILIDTAPAAAAGLSAHIGHYVPPLFAKVEEVTDSWAVVGIYGPGADEVAAAVIGPEEQALAGESGAPGDDGRVVPMDGGFAVRTRVTGDPGWDLFIPAEQRDSWIERLLEAGGRPGDPLVLEALRIAAGVPRWGRELTEDVIPLEAGLLEPAISQTKGCYTGQEVIIRILHRGHVNRHLRRLEFAGPAPPPGTELFEEGVDRPRGVVTSSVENDVGALGLGYVRREVEPPAELRVGSPDGDPVLVTPLD